MAPGGVARLIAVTILAAGGLLASPAAAAERPSRLVNPFMGTVSGAPDFGTGGGAGNTYPGATAPFGMLNWSPDTHPSYDNFAGGYTYDDREIEGFSLTHLSGAGCAGYQDFPFVPTTNTITEAPSVRGSADLDPALLSSFRHRRESAAPGRYAVTLNPGEPRRRIGVRLAASTRAGVATFAFPRGRPANLLVNAAGNGMANPLASVRVRPDRRELEGVSETGSFCWARPYSKIYVVARFDRPFRRFATWRDQTLTEGARSAADTAENPFTPKPLGGVLPPPGSPSTTAQAGAYLGFGTGGRVTARVGISFTWLPAARRTLAREVGGAPVTEIAQRTARRWNQVLGKVDVEGGGRESRRLLYTSLYHAMLEPRIFDDADGSYPRMGRDGVATTRADRYADFSGWDTYRTQIPFMAMLLPERAADFAESLLEFADGGGCLPKWSFADGHTMVMTGDPAAQALGSLDAFGADVDRRRALRALVRGAEGDCRVEDPAYVQRPGGEEFRDRGWIGYEREAEFGRDNSRFSSPDGLWGPAATTLEYAGADFAIAQIAARSCAEETYERAMERSGYWRNVFDRGSRRVLPRQRSGAFRQVPPRSMDGFVEGSSEQYTYMVPHDPAGLAAAAGGRRELVSRLDRFFQRLNAGPESARAYLGNEPNLGAPWLYDWLGRPDRTQRVVRTALRRLYSPTPGGFPGNDDLGTLSAWWVLSSIGLYPAIPGTDVLAIGSPLFREVRVEMKGGPLVIRAPDAGAGAPFVRGLRLDGRALQRPWIRFSDLRGGRELVFSLARTPQDWGSAPRSAPPSFGANRPLPRRCG